MPDKKVAPRWFGILPSIVALSIAACHREVKVPALVERNVALSDVWLTGPDQAFIAGARGKLLLTEDGGLHFRRVELGTDLGHFWHQDDRRRERLLVRARRTHKCAPEMAARAGQDSTHARIYISFRSRFPIDCMAFSLAINR
jgi:hypothetical protein